MNGVKETLITLIIFFSHSFSFISNGILNRILFQQAVLILLALNDTNSRKL